MGNVLILFICDRFMYGQMRPRAPIAIRQPAGRKGKACDTALVDLRRVELTFDIKNKELIGFRSINMPLK